MPQFSPNHPERRQNVAQAADSQRKQCGERVVVHSLYTYVHAEE
jgi:hypothetical protein